MKRQRLTPRIQQRKNNKSLSPQNVQPKIKNKENQQNQKKTGKENQSANDKQENSLKICLDLANHHRKEAEELKTKNQTLQRRLKDQLSDMQNLKKELSSIKNVLHSNQVMKKDNQDLKLSNSCLKKQNQKLANEVDQLKIKINELNQQLAQFKQKKPQAESILLVADSKCENYDINTLTLAKQSRRQQYTNNYQSFTFVPSMSCLECGKKANEIEQMKDKYCNQLRQLQQQVIELQRSQIAIQVMENQMVYKNQCINLLVKELDNMERNSNDILEGMSFLQSKIQKVKPSTSEYKSQKLNNSFSLSLV